MSSKKNHNLEKNLADEKQRFGIRKFSVGVASVLLGTSLMLGANTQIVHADSENGGINSSTETTSEVQSKSENDAANTSNVKNEAKATENKVENSNTESQSAKAGAVDQSKNSSEDQSTTKQKINNKKTESLEKKADDSSLTIEKSTQLQNDQSDKVTEDTKKNEDSKDTTLNLQSAQHVTKSALKESKAVTPAKQVSAILNIYDYGDVDPQTPNANHANDVAFTYNGTFTDGLSIKDAIQAQIDADTQKQLAYKDQGTAIIPDKDGLPTEIGVSPVISAPFSDNDLGGYFFRDKTTTTYQQNNQTQLVDAYNKWLDYKQAHFALAGYKLVDQDEQAINLDDPIEDGKTYNIYVNHQLSVVNVYHWTELKRTVEFKYYYKQDDKNAQAADSVTKNGYYNDGKYNQTQPEQFINTAGEPVFSNLPKKDSIVNQTDISDANSFETRLLPDDLKTTKDQTKVLHDTINSRYIDLAVGLITDSHGNLNNYGKASMIYPSGTILFEGEPVKQIDNWHTFDPNVPDTGSDDINDTNTYSTVQGGFNKGTGYVIEPVDNPATTTIYYYHDQPVNITFEDVTNGDANAPVLSNFTASKDLRVDLNSQYIPGKPHTTPKDKKNNKNQKYEAYSYQADDNTYSTNAINVDPSGTLKSSKSLNYADILKAYTDNGYVLVSSDPDDLTYELEDVYDNNRNLQHKKRVVKLVHRAVAHTDTKTATRTIHYVANTKDGKQLQDDTTQNVTLTSSTYYTDAVTGNRVNAKQDTNGDWIVDTENAAALPAITWTVNADKSTGLTTDDKNFAAITTPETIILDAAEAAKRGTDEGAWYLVSTDKNGEVSYGDPTSDTWKTDTPNKIADGYLIYKQKAQYNIHYIDVNGVEGKTTYVPTDGHELTDHLVPNVGEGKGIFVGDTPDATSKLWSSADYEKAGYVLVGLSDNAKGDLLGKQTLTKGVQDQYVYLKHAVKTITPNTPASEVPKDPDGNPIVDPSDLHKEFHRTIFYKANTPDGATLMGQTDQKTEFNGTIAYDVVTGKTTTPETVKDVNGKDVQVATLKDGTITWDKQNDEFSAINQPTIELKKGDKYATSDDMIGTWFLVDGEAGEVDLTPASKNPDDKTLVYKQKAQYNIHYIDVNGVEDTTAYVPTDGKELTNHLVQNVGEGKDIYVGDTPDATSKLWSPANYEKAGYVLVGLSDNAKGDLLGKQTLTKGVQDQYVYLKHAVKDITPNTPAHDVPKDPDGKRAIDPSDLHKEFTRTITFVANNDAKSPLKDRIPQKVEFDGHIYVDMVTGQTTTPETVKDANGKTTQVATTKAGNIEWNHDTQTMDEVVQKYITLNKGDKYATSDDMVGTWHWISGVANEITLKPTSDNPEDLELVYEKNKGESGPDLHHDLPKLEIHHVTVHYVDEDGNVIKDPVKDPADFKNGESYDENSKKDSTIEHDGKTYEFTRVKEGDVPAGTIQGKDVDVTYVYKLKETPVTPPSENTYNVTVNFVDEHGNVLQDPRHSSDHKNGTDYNESDHPTTITKDGKTYTYIRVEDDKPTGTINGRDVVITYVYKEVETPTEPTNPSTPSEPTTPTEPTNPTQPSTPSEPSTPTTPSEPDTPSTPSEPSTPTTPSEPDTPSTPSEPSTPTTPSEPDTPSTPDETPDESATPSKPAKKTNFDNDVAPSHESYTNKAKFENVNAKKKSTSTNAALAEDTIAAHKTPKYRRSVVPQSDRILPQTGEKKTSESAIVGLAALALSGIISLAIDRKRKN
ncbi:YSIRK-type signal peptide-containing protein [Lactobacillus intestinalis]|uniref:YSIRK-type signal peptide-containing protein n=1 Tax=Lactobacillus intestinalis TaxID=151781 RepID=UPI0032B12EED